MKPRLLALPLISGLLASSAFAGQFVWTGAANSTWTIASNWDTTSTPPVSPDLFPALGGDYASDFLTIRNNGDLTAEVPGTNPGAGAVYNPGAGVTTTFRSGRGFVVGIGNGPGATPPNVKGRADLTITSGTIAAVRGANSGSEPFMANRADVNLLINGGHLDLSQHLNNFRLIQEGFPGITSTITIDSGSLSCNLLDLYFDTVGEDPADRFGTGIINLNGGILALNRFNITNPPPAEQSSFKINLNGGILRARNTNANFLPDLPDTQVIVKSGGAIIDTNTFNSTIAAPLLHDPLLGESLDGGLTKNGRGNLTLSGTNTFNGDIIVNAGTALTEGSRIILGANDESAGSGSITLADSFAELQLGIGRNIANPLVISDTGNEKTLYFVNAGASEYSGPITLDETNIDHFRVRSDVNCFFTLSGKISGSGGIYKFQSGAVYLTNGANDFTGGVKIAQGLLSFTSGALGTTGSILMDGGTLRWATGNTEDVSARMVMVDAKTATFATNDNNVSFANAIGDSSTGNLQKNGPGILTLNGTSSYTGNTIVLGGILMLEATASITSSASVSISAGATLDASAQATYTIPGAQPLTFGIDATGSGSSGSITAADLDISAAVVSYNITGTPDDPVYVLATYNNFVGTPSFASVDPAPEGYTLDYAYQGNKIALVQAAGSPYEIWSDGAPFDGDANGDGVMDGLAFLLGAENINDNALGLLPTVTQSGSGLVLTFKSLNAASRGSAVLTVEHSSDLGISDAWLGAVIPDTEGISGPVNGVTFNVSPGSPTNAVIATISSDQTATGKLFGRLKAENP